MTSSSIAKMGRAQALPIMVCIATICASTYGQAVEHFGLDRGDAIPFLKWRNEKGDEKSTFSLRGHPFILVIGDDTCSRCLDALNEFKKNTTEIRPIITLIIDEHAEMVSYNLSLSKKFPMRSVLGEIGMMLPRTVEELDFGGEVCRPPLPYLANIDEHGNIRDSNLLVEPAE